MRKNKAETIDKSVIFWYKRFIQYSEETQKGGNMSRKIVHYTVALAFDGATTRKAIELNRDFADRAAHPNFVQSEYVCLPHLSLMHIRLDTEGLWKCIEELEALTVLDLPIKGRFTKLESRCGWLFWIPEEHSKIRFLHEFVVLNLARHRAGNLPRRYKLKGKRKELKKHFGTEAVLDYYNPHLTVQRLRKPFQERSFGTCEQAWHATEIVIGKVGDHGSITEIEHGIHLPNGL